MNSRAMRNWSAGSRTSENQLRPGSRFIRNESAVGCTATTSATFSPCRKASR